MLFLKLFLIFTKIGTFNFGGGYAMLSLIHNETVVKNHWLTNAEFTDIVAISQSTPGPIGINCATYVGYTACLHDGYPTWAACLGSVLASLSIMWLPFIIMILISRYLITHKDSKIVKDIFAGLRPAIIGLIAAAAVLLMNDADDGGVLFGVGVGNFAGVVLGAVIHKDDLHVVAAFQKRLDTVLHVSLRIIAGDRECQQFHKIRSYCSRIPSHRVRARSAMASIL